MQVEHSASDAFRQELTGDATAGDDLAQEALLKAWTANKSFMPGTNMKAWVFMIVRNQFFSDKRRSWRSSQLDPETAERTLIAVTSANGTAAPWARSRAASAGRGTRSR